MSTELRATLAALPNRRAVLRVMTESRDDLTNPLRHVWALLVAELADIDSTERATIRHLDTDIPWPAWPEE